MSTFDGAKKFTIDEFGGAKPILDVVDVEVGDAQVALNCEFVPGQVTTRKGFAIAWDNPLGVTASLFFWVSGTTCYLARLSTDVLTTSIIVRNLSTGAEYTLKSAILASGSIYDWGAVFASNGARLYSVITTMGGPTLTGAYVWDGDVTHTADSCFQRPMKTTEVTVALTQPGAGVATAGTHYVGVLFETRSGYWTRPGPVNSSLVLQPQSIVSTGTNNIRATLTPASTWPDWISNVQLIYTTTLNDFQYYTVPGTITPVTAGSATVYTIDFSVSDLQIRAVGSQGAGTLADDYFSLLSMNASNVAPFVVSNVVTWGNRLVWFGNYGGIDSFFPSDPLNFEWISADQHIQQLPGGQSISAAFVLQGILYVIARGGGMFAYRDNGGRPVTFQPPQLIDGSISVNSIFCVSVAASGARAAIAGAQGLYLYSGGAFPQVPASFYQAPDWEPITPVGVKDFTIDQTVVVQASTGTMYTWNYQDGYAPKQLKYSKWTKSGLGIHGGMETVFNPTTNVWELWAANGGLGGGVLRKKSTRSADTAATLYTDYLTNSSTPLGIDFQYQTSTLPPNLTGDVLNHLGCRMRVRALQQASHTISAISKATVAIATSVAHGFTSGSWPVVISGATGTGWTTINAAWTITYIDADHFSIPVDSTGFGTLGGTVSVLSLGSLAVSAVNLDSTASVVPVTSPMAIAYAPGQFYHMFYDMQGELMSYLFTNRAAPGNGLLISRVTHFYNLEATQR